MSDQMYHHMSLDQHGKIEPANPDLVRFTVNPSIEGRWVFKGVSSWHVLPHPRGTVWAERRMSSEEHPETLWISRFAFYRDGHKGQLLISPDTSLLSALHTEAYSSDVNVVPVFSVETPFLCWLETPDYDYVVPYNWAMIRHIWEVHRSTNYDESVGAKNKIVAKVNSFPVRLRDEIAKSFSFDEFVVEAAEEKLIALYNRLGRV